MAWSRVKFYYANNLSNLSATSTASGNYDVANLYDMLEGTYWQAVNTATQYITFDAGAGKTEIADYIAIGNHNLYTAGATIVLQYSTDNFASDINDAFTAFAPGDNKAFVKEFTLRNKRYWRLKITSMSVVIYMAILIWGSKTELDFVSSSFDPHGQEVKATINKTQAGYIAGIHIRYTERVINLKFNNADPALYSKINAWWEVSGLKNFFLGWEPTDHSSDVYLVHPGLNFVNPLIHGGLYRDITINLKGRKE